MTKRVAVAIGVDIGSTNTKVVALDRDGGVRVRAARPTPRERGRLTVNAEALLRALEDMIVEVCGDRYALHAVSVAGVGEDGVLVDAELKALTPALAWFDPLRSELLHELELADDDVFDVQSDAACTIVGWSWARSRLSPGTACTWVALTDLPSVRWSGRAFMSDTLASRTAAWRSRDRSWAVDRVEAALGDPGRLPPLAAAGEVVGPLRSETLASAGVAAPGAVVVAGGHDHPIAGWGAEQITPGAVLDSMGTAEVVVAQIPGSRRPGGGVEVAPGIRSSGTTLLHVEELARNVQWASRDPEVAGCIRGILEGGIEPEPVLESGYFVPGRRGGGTPAYSVDAPSTPIVRASAVLGSLACAGRAAVDLICGESTDRSRVRSAGGWLRSPGWVAIKSRVNGYRPVPIFEPEVTAVGAALLAATAYGWRPDPVRALGGFAASLLP